MKAWRAPCRARGADPRHERIATLEAAQMALQQKYCCQTATVFIGHAVTLH